MLRQPLSGEQSPETVLEPAKVSMLLSSIKAKSLS